MCCPIVWGNSVGVNWDGEKGCLAGPPPYVGQLELANVPVKGWITDPDVHVLYDPSDAVHLPAHYGEVVHIDVMTRDIAMVIEGWRGL